MLSAHRRGVPGCVGGEREEALSKVTFGSLLEDCVKRLVIQYLVKEIREEVKERITGAKACDSGGLKESKEK